MPKCLKTLGSPSDLLQLERAEVMTGVRPQIDFEGKASRIRLGTMVEYEGRRGTKEDSKDSGLKHWKDGAAMKHDRGKCGRGTFSIPLSVRVVTQVGISVMEVYA